MVSVACSLEIPVEKTELTDEAKADKNIAYSIFLSV
jgi:hypothetical protein